MIRIMPKDLEKLDHRKLVYFCLFCAKQVEHLIEIPESKEALNAVEKWLVGEATAEECLQATNAAHNAYVKVYANAHSSPVTRAADVAYVTIYSTICSTIDAVKVAYAASSAVINTTSINSTSNKRINAVGRALIKEQWEYYYELLNVDKNLEEIILGK